MDKTYENAINLLTSQGKFYINLGLDRTLAVLNLLGNPQNQLKCIHVAGTNGKGSVCAILSTILSENGFKTGLFTSPHIFEYTERIKINGVQIERDTFAAKIFKIHELAEENAIHLTEFEIITVLMFDYFAENAVEYVVLETGLGGRFDATNVIKENVCAIITSIDFDHTERLGDTIEKIAFEKAGIIKNSPVVVSRKNLGFETIKRLAGDKLKVANNYHFDELNLKGLYQMDNLSLALTALSVFLPDIKMDVILRAISKVQHPCRFQMVKEKGLIIDGAHNPSGIKALRHSLDTYFPDYSFRFVFGCLKNKDYKAMAELLFRESDEIYFFEFNNPNACTYEDFRIACPYEVKRFVEFNDTDKITVICGSFYMIEELLELIK